MSKAWAKRPSPAMIVALIALFAALGGSAYAAKKIGSKEIKANAITTGKIKKNAITTSKIKKEAVTGAKIKETTLGAVPNATHATSADSATNATNATNFSRYFTSGIVKASPGQNPTLLVIGPFTITGHCNEPAANEYEAYTTISTSQNGSSLAAYEDNYYEADFDPGDPAELSYEVQSTTPESSQYQEYYAYDWFMATSGDAKTQLSGNSVNAVHYFGSPCAFWASATNAG